MISPLASNILLTPFDREMRRRGYQLTRYADDWCITCQSAVKARAALKAASRILEQLGDRQSESSIDDQVRVCTDWCERNQVSVVARFEDQGISGAAIGNRPGLQRALAAAVDVLVVMNLTRLSRSQADLPKLIDRLIHRGVRVVGVQDCFDSARKGHKLQAGLTGIIGEAFREMAAIARKLLVLRLRSRERQRLRQ